MVGMVLVMLSENSLEDVGTIILPCICPNDGYTCTHKASHFNLGYVRFSPLNFRVKAPNKWSQVSSKF
jgi:hypothetical protein